MPPGAVIPDAEFLAALARNWPRCAAAFVRAPAPRISAVGGLTAEWAKKTGLREGMPVAVGAFDAHLGAVGCGIAPGTLVKIIGTSTCDIAVCAATAKSWRTFRACAALSDGSVLPGYYGLEAGQSAVGDIFNWFVNYIQPGGGRPGSHEALSARRREVAGRANPACWRWIGTTATAPFWWTSA